MKGMDVKVLLQSQILEFKIDLVYLHLLLDPGFEPGASRLGVLRATVAPDELIFKWIVLIHVD